MTATFAPFATTDPEPVRQGTEALLYVMTHGHTISVPDVALRFAEKVAIMSIAPRDTAAPVLADVNRALDIIAMSLRHRDRMDREAAKAAAVSVPPKSGTRPGHLVKLLTPQPQFPPTGAMARPF